jgi:putative NIF3 family GTP cyclohydrolase 1 type 2
MVRVKDIIEYVESLSGHSLNSDEGVQYGRIDAQVQKVLVCWMATRNALENAGKIGCDLVIAHESLYYPYDAAVRKDTPAGWQECRT